jgi:large subunit ribosomal protein L32
MTPRVAAAREQGDTSMPVPKRKTSQSKRDSRRAQQKLEVDTASFCPQCKSPKLPHRACPKCGTYKGREVIPQATEQPKKK